MSTRKISMYPWCVIFEKMQYTLSHVELHGFHHVFGSQSPQAWEISDCSNERYSRSAFLSGVQGFLKLLCVLAKRRMIKVNVERSIIIVSFD